jgi:hypothetical protein
LAEKIEVKETPIKQEEQKEVFAWVNEYQQNYFNTKYPKGLESFADFVIPTNYNEQVKRAKELRDIGLVNRLLLIRRDYTLPIKEFRCKSKRQQKFYNEKVLPLVKRLAKQWCIEYNSVGEVFVHYSFKNDKKTPMFIRIEDAEQIAPINIFGKELYEVRISSQLKKQIQKLKTIIDDPNIPKDDKRSAKNIIDAMPDYIREIINGKNKLGDKIVLDYRNMYRSVNQQIDYKLRSLPPILRIMKSIILREFLTDLDFCNSFGSQKTSLTHAKGGTKEKPWPPEKVEKLHKLITEGPPGSKIISTGGDCEIVAVDNKLTEMLEPKRFQQCNKDILDFFGISAIFIPTETSGINNTGVSVSLKPFTQSIKTDREVFQEFLNVFFQEINERNDWNEIPEILYQRINLTDENLLLKELQFLADRGVLSFEKVCLDFDLSYEEIMKEKENDWNNRDIQAPVIELSQGTSPMLTKKFEQELKLKESSKANIDNSNEKNNV